MVDAESAGFHRGNSDRHGLPLAGPLVLERWPVCGRWNTLASNGKVLPCYWVYHEVGRELARLGSPTAVYQRWIDNYSSEEFEAVTVRVRSILDREASTASPGSLTLGRRSYLIALRYEWMFWDMAWRMESWPVSDKP